MITNEHKTKADFNPAKHHNDAGFRNPEPTHDAEKSDVVFLSMAQAAKMTGYHQDYLGQMARSGKLEAVKVGRNWQTTKLGIDKMLGRVPKEESQPVVQTPPQPVVKMETPTPEVTKIEVPKIEAPRAEVPRAESPKVEVPKISTPMEVASEVAGVNAVTSSPPKPIQVEVAKPLTQEISVAKLEPVKVEAQKISTPQPVKVMATPPHRPAMAPPPRAVISQSRLVGINITKPEPIKFEPPKVIAQLTPIPTRPIVRPAPQIIPQPIVAEQKPAAVPTKNISQKVNIKHLSTSDDAGPNLQELIAGYSQDEVKLMQDIGIDNREKLFKWNRMAPQVLNNKNNFTPKRVMQFARQHPEPEAVEVPVAKTKPIWAYAAAGVTTIVLFAAGYLGSNYLNNPSTSDLTALTNPNRMVAGESTSVTEPTTGKAIVPIGATEYIVENDSITDESTIVITLRADYEGRYWVSGQKAGQFTLRFSDPLKHLAPFDYMILVNEDGGTP